MSDFAAKWALRHITDAERARVRARLPRLPDSWRPDPSTFYQQDGTRLNAVTRDATPAPRKPEIVKPQKRAANQ